MEWIFRSVFVAGFIFAAVATTRTARRAQRRHGRSINEIRNEIPILIPIRVALGLIFYSSLIVWLLNIHAFGWSFLRLPIAARIGGLLLLIAGLALQWRSLQEIGENYRGGIGLNVDHSLVQSGPYSRMRHPIYMSFILMMIAITFVSSNWVMGLSGLILVVMIAVLRIPLEERELETRFNDEWQSYKMRTGRVAPYP